MSFVSKFVQDLADHWPLETLDDSPIRRRLWIGLLQTLQPADPIDVSYYGMRLHVDPRQRQTLARQAIMRCGYETFPTSVLKRLLRPEMTFVDVGANFGHYTLIAAQSVGPLGRVTAFEPSPIAFRELSNNVRLNAFENVDMHQVALGACTGTASLYHDARRGGHHSLARENLREPGTETVVEVHRLDDLQYRWDRPIDILKLDTQGSEVAILTGAIRTLTTDRPVILSEFWPYGIRHVGDSPDRFGDILSSLDYRFLRIGSREIAPVNFEALQRELSADERRHDANLLGIPEERWHDVVHRLGIVD